MTLKETGMVMAILQAAFPAYYRGISEADAAAAVRLWADMFADDPAEDVTAAVKAIIATQVEGYPPTVGAVKAKLLELRHQGGMTAQEAWALAARAAAGNLKWERLPPLVQKAIGSKGILREWGRVPIDTFNTVIYSQFVKAYGIYAKREREEKLLPAAMRRTLAGMAERMALSQGKGEEQR